MCTTQVREVPETLDLLAATRPDMVRAEPSHIHIPRPSRVGRAIASRHEDGDPMPVQLTLETAAA